VTAYQDEEALQTLLAASPNLLPLANPDAPVVVASEVGTTAGPVDLVAVDALGEIALVECKLRANPDIRRSIVGQLMAYAAAVWTLSYDEFDRAISKRLHDSLADTVESRVSAAGTEWDADEFRTRVSRNLGDGRLRLIFAVDQITDELRRIVEFVNSHTHNDLQVVALELGYVADEGVEVLVPREFGQETADRKSAPSAPHQWTPEAVIADLTGRLPETTVDFVSRLIEWTRNNGGSFSNGTGKSPSVSGWMRVEGHWVSTWALYGADATLAINFGTMAKKVSRDRLIAVASALAAIPGAPEAFRGVANGDLNRYPGFRLAQVAAPDTLAAIEGALASLLDRHTFGVTD
jgi:hypothetical protein